MLNRLRKTLMRPLAVLAVAAVATGLGAPAFAQEAGDEAEAMPVPLQRCIDREAVVDVLGGRLVGSIEAEFGRHAARPLLAAASLVAAGVAAVDELVEAYQSAGDWRTALAEMRAGLGEDQRAAVREASRDLVRQACRRHDGDDRRPDPGPLMTFVIKTLGGPEAVKEIHEEYGFGRRDLVALAVLVRLSGEDVEAVASLKTEDNSWTDVASALDVDEELVRLLLALLRHARHDGPAAGDREDY